MLMTGYLWSRGAGGWALHDQRFMPIRPLLWMKSNGCCCVCWMRNIPAIPHWQSVVVVWLRVQGYIVNRKRGQRLMRTLGLVAMAPGPNTSKKHPQNKIYPYLLRGLEIIRPDHVWG